MKAGMNKLALLVFVGVFSAMTAGCDEPGPLERAGEEVDEAVDTLKRGEESPANKLDDAVDDVRDGVNDAKDELKK